LDVVDLRVFEAVARLGGMSPAAAELNTVQSNVTARIRMLEEELSAPLFHRHSRGVALTDAGRALLPYASTVLQTLRDARRAVGDNGIPKGRLTIGSLETTVGMRLSPLLSRYVNTYPDVDLVLRTGTTCELLESVLAAELEGAFVCGPIDHPKIIGEVIFREELVLLTAPSIRSLDRALAQANLRIIVLRAGCSYRERLEELLTKRGLSELRQLEFGTLEAIFGCVEAGLGVTLLPKGLVGPVLRDGRVAMHKLPPDEAMTDTLFIRLRDGFVSSALAAFVQLSQSKSTKQPNGNRRGIGRGLT
jgi:LysR family transcriptional regulator, cell division regulator